VVGLILADLLQVVVEGSIVSGIRKITLGELGEAFTIEVVFEVLESQGIVKNVR
jgi:hypothetical protein